MKFKKILILLNILFIGTSLFGVQPAAQTHKRSPALVAAPPDFRESSSDSDDSASNAGGAAASSKRTNGHSRSNAVLMEPMSLKAEEATDAKRNTEVGGRKLTFDFLQLLKRSDLKPDFLSKLEQRTPLNYDQVIDADTGQTPLMIAALSLNQPVVEYLIKKKVNLNAQDASGSTALILLLYKIYGLKGDKSDKAKKLALYLIDEMYKKDQTIGLSIYNHEDRTAIEIAQEKLGDVDLFQKLYTYGAKNHPKYDFPTLTKENSPTPSPRKDVAESATNGNGDKQAIERASLNKALEVLKRRKDALKARTLEHNLKALEIE
jgi:hypothetical protein